MDQLWSTDEPQTVRQVHEALSARRELAYTTVMTVLTRLLAKNVVTRRREGRSFVWMPVADQAGLAALKMRKVLDGQRDRRAVLASFVTSLPEGDEQLLRELLDQAADED